MRSSKRVARDVLPELAAEAARDGRPVRIWSAGCACGQEPYTIAIVWRLAIAPAHPGVAVEILATDVDETMLARAAERTYAGGTLRELAPAWREAAFDRAGDMFRLRDDVARMVVFRREDLRTTMPDGPFDVILCRNVAFTYFDEAAQHAVAAGLVARLRPGGALVFGAHEGVPSEVAGWEGAPLPLRRRPR